MLQSIAAFPHDSELAPVLSDILAIFLEQFPEPIAPYVQFLSAPGYHRQVLYTVVQTGEKAGPSYN